ncbi:30S ribosomal protein S2 [Patulibacter brassicae]|jgi:small subunit ribosomal protein S2|uniref:Small ribosomal subunit protein uS2 n=1 Tax=Patulibacter brassicae TaxID=1705717 RepID=A0ABU4VGH4_9ACTN|nr:30S ribosomal protein S2 [Patulibacter brassicae]MDX8150259.1 30S ribosomal protein S2 [Patulibacter brassicae]
MSVAEVGIKDLLESGVHFGHQTRRWNPRMARFIHGEHAGLHVIDLLQTVELLKAAQGFVSDLAQRGGTVLFVGTKRQSQDAIRHAAESARMPYVNQRWSPGLLTNFQTSSRRIKTLNDLEQLESQGQLELLPSQERIARRKELAKLQINLGGVKDLRRTPDAVFVIDVNTEKIAVEEARKLRIPVVALTDTNVDPDGVEYVIPGNDDSIRSCSLIAHAVGDAAASGALAWYEAEEARRAREAAEREQRAAEEAARREAEDARRLEAEEQSAAAAQGQEAQAQAEAAAAAEQAAPAAETTPESGEATSAPQESNA